MASSAAKKKDKQTNKLFHILKKFSDKRLFFKNLTQSLAQKQKIISKNSKFSGRIRLQTFSIFILSFFFKLRILLFSPLAIWLAVQVPPLPLSPRAARPPTLTPSLFSLVKETLPSDLSSCIPQRKSKLRIRDRRKETRVQKRGRELDDKSLFDD